MRSCSLLADSRVSAWKGAKGAAGLGMCLVLVLMCLTAVPVYGQPRMYITGRLEITLRGGPGTDYRILKFLKSGDLVEILEEDPEKSWTRVRDETGDEGWVLTRWLVRERPLFLVAKSLMQENASLKQQTGEYMSQLSELRAENERLGKDLETAVTSRDRFESQYESLRTESKDFLQLKEQWQDLTSRYATLEDEYRLTRRERDESFNRHLWMVYGGVIFVAGVVAGSLSRKSKATRRRGLVE